jgi:hypothetical protein
MADSSIHIGGRHRATNAFIPSPKSKATLLTRIGYVVENDDNETRAVERPTELSFDTIFLYLHGFPDMSVDFR